MDYSNSDGDIGELRPTDIDVRINEHNSHNLYNDNNTLPVTDFKNVVDRSERIDSGFDSGDVTCFYSEERETNNAINQSDIEKEEEEEEEDVMESCDSMMDIADGLSGLKIDDRTRCDSGLSDDIDSGGMEGSRILSPQEVIPKALAARLFLQDRNGDNQLHLSIIDGFESISHQIISLAPDGLWLSQWNHLFQTPLHLAVITRQPTVVAKLVAFGATLEVCDRSGNTPLHIACGLGYEDMVKILLTPVIRRPKKHRRNIHMPKIPQDLNKRNYEGLSCLHLAVIGRHLEVVKMLLSAGADVNFSEAKSGRTVLHMAAEWGYLETLDILLRHPGIDMECGTYAGWTPLMLAVGRDRSDSVEVLMRHGVD